MSTILICQVQCSKCFNEYDVYCSGIINCDCGNIIYLDLCVSDEE